MQSQLVTEADVAAIMRRMDADGDDELSFADFFSGLLPYFINCEAKTEALVSESKRKKSKAESRSIFNIHIPRPNTANCLEIKPDPS